MSARRFGAGRFGAGRGHPWLVAGTASLLVVVVIGALLWWLRATAPQARIAPLDLGDGSDLLTCVALEAEDPVLPVGLGRATSDQVLRCPVAFDQRSVRYVGEVVGDVLGRGGGSWLLVNDDAYALGPGPLGASQAYAGGNSGLTVWLPDPIDDPAPTPGRGDRRGDVIEVVGVVHRADPADGGGLTVRATSVEVLAPSETLDLPLHVRQIGVAVVLGALAVVVLVREQRSRSA